ncbi:MAG: hypothetical protein HYY37_04060 [Candidatus Aenigmarchaeota archaeon]|nr:hypothetical protein [Candidatus Aenigmarchaeota archaeon]
MAVYRNIPVRAITESASREAEEVGLNLDDIASLLADSYDCGKGKRRKGIEERCVRTGGRILKIVTELKTSKSGFDYWRIRQIGFVG